MLALIRACILATILAAQPATAATLSGTVADASGKPIRDARVDHTGRMVVVAATAFSGGCFRNLPTPQPSPSFITEGEAEVRLIRKFHELGIRMSEILLTVLAE
jgi:uncharacterized membrane protein YeiH